ncbi:MAG: hypothetical protein PVH98_00130 [Gammaproteobacteria bacterium]|jgi:hypothetical protein
MDKMENLSMEIRINRIIIGSLLILFGMSSTISPLGGVAVVPLLGAVIVLAGIFNWKSVPEALYWLKKANRASSSLKSKSSAVPSSTAQVF